jgi:hypothetical protein
LRLHRSLPQHRQAMVCVEQQIDQVLRSYRSDRYRTFFMVSTINGNHQQ